MKKAGARVVVIISGRGSNLKSLVERAEGYEIVRVLSNKPDAPGLSWAAGAGIPADGFDRASFPSAAEHKAAIYDAVRRENPDFVALAGYMQLIEPAFTAEFYGRLINIHPSLLPEFPGLDTHARAIAAGATEHGCTVHLVDEGVDTGMVIAQAKLGVARGEVVARLSSAVLNLEHVLYPWTLSMLASGELRIDGRELIASAAARTAARERSFFIPHC